MKIYIFKAMMIAVICVAVFSRSHTAAQEAGGAPPDLEKGWNLISVPCTVRVDELAREVLRRHTYYSWDGDAWVRAGKLERGRGYAVDTNSVVNTSSICEHRLPDPPVISLAEGWNLVGNPYHKAVRISDMLGDFTGAVRTVYEYRGNRLVRLESDSELKPWRGYWVYSVVAIDVNVAQDCRLEISASGAPDGSGVYHVVAGENLNLSAKYTCEIEGIEDTIKATGAVEWMLGEGGVGEIAGAVYTSAAGGGAEITASCWKQKSNTLKIIATDPLLEECRGENPLRIIPVSVEYPMFPGGGGLLYTATDAGGDNAEEGACLFCDGETKCTPNDSSVNRGTFWYGKGTVFELKAVCGAEGRDVSSGVKWIIGNKNIVIQDGQSKFNVMGEGTTTVTAEYGEMKSRDYKVNVKETDFSLKISGETPSLTCVEQAGDLCNGYERIAGVGKEQQFRATVEYGENFKVSGFVSCDGKDDFAPGHSKESQDVTSKVEWRYEADSGLENLANGKIRILSEGPVRVYAQLGGETAGPLDVLAVDENKPPRLSIKPGTPMILNLNESKSLKAELAYATRVEDVTDQAEWFFDSYSGSGLASVKKGVVTARVNTGNGAVYASYKGLYSNSIPLVVEDTGYFWFVDLYGYNEINIFFSGIRVFIHVVGESFRLNVSGFMKYYYHYHPNYDVTSSVKWRISNTSVLKFVDGKFKAEKEGISCVRAEYFDAVTNTVCVVVTSAKGGGAFLLDKPEPVKKGNYSKVNSMELIIKPGNCHDWNYSSQVGNFCVSREWVPGPIEWKNTNPEVASLESSQGTFRSVSSGVTYITAEHNGIISNTVPLEVWDESSIPRCNQDSHNISEWKGEFSLVKATIETNCSDYREGEPVVVQYTASTYDGRGSNRCLDMYILDQNGEKVKTLRHDGCSNEPMLKDLARSYPPIFQNTFDWDMTDDAGDPVPPGRYFAASRFHIDYIDPVVSVSFTIHGAGDE